MFFFPLLFTLLVYWTIGLNTFAPYKFIIFWLTYVCFVCIRLFF